MSYESPKKKLHRSFVYLDDELVINSLSAFEAGQIDDIVSKIVDAKENSFGGSISANALGTVNVNAEGKKGKHVSFEDELIRKRTKFSVFEAWYNCLEKGQALGKLDNPSNWLAKKPDIGDVIEVRGKVRMHEIFSLVRMFNDYAKSTKIPGHPWYVKGEQAKEISNAVKIFKYIFGEEGKMLLPAYASDNSSNPKISFVLQEQKILGNPGPIEGHFNIVGQVVEILDDKEWSPTLRLMPLAPKSEFERKTVQDMLSRFEDSAMQFGVSNVANMGEFQGPALILEPIAIYR